MFDYTLVAPSAKPGLPILDDATRQRMDQLSGIVILSEDPAQVQQGKAVYEQNAGARGMVTAWVDEGRFEGQNWGYSYAIARSTSPPPPEPVSSDATVGWLDIATLRSDGTWAPASVSAAKGAATINSYPGPGGFSATIDIPEALRRQGPGKLRIWIHVKRGSFGTQLYPTGDNSEVLGIPAATGTVSNVEMVVEIATPDLSVPLSLMFVNQAGDGPSIASVRAIEVVTDTPQDKPVGEQTTPNSPTSIPPT